MIPDVKINGISMLSSGWLRESIDFPTPQSQSETVVVPGRNTPIRYTEALGRVSYQPRSFDIVLIMLGTRSLFNQMSSDIINRFAGVLCNVILNEESTYYYTGTIEITPSYDPLTGKGQLQLSCTDGDSYKYKTTETVITKSGAGTISLQNDFMPVVPQITVSAQTTLSWSVDGVTYSKTLSAGQWEIPEFELRAGENTVKITGSGNTTFRYREGRL